MDGGVKRLLMAKARQDYTEDRSWSDQYLLAGIKLCGYLFAEKSFSVSPPDEDIKRCSDLTWIRTIEQDGKRIGMRIRKPDVWAKYPYDFTLRSKRTSGVKTEFEKIVTDGYGDILVYAHADENIPGKLAHHWIVDLAAFRMHFQSGQIKTPREKNNGDGTYFFPFDVRRMPTGVILFGSDAHLCHDKIATTPRPQQLFKPSKIIPGIPFTEQLPF